MSIYISTREKDLGGERGKSKKEVGVRNADGVYRQWYLEIGGGRGTGRSHCSALKSRPLGVSPRIPDLVSSSACACRGGVGLSELAWGLQRKEGRGWVKVK